MNKTDQNIIRFDLSVLEKVIQDKQNEFKEVAQLVGAYTDSDRAEENLVAFTKLDTEIAELQKILAFINQKLKTRREGVNPTADPEDFDQKMERLRLKIEIEKEIREDKKYNLRDASTSTKAELVDVSTSTEAIVGSSGPLVLENKGRDSIKKETSILKKIDTCHSWDNIPRNGKFCIQK